MNSMSLLEYLVYKATKKSSILWWTTVLGKYRQLRIWEKGKKSLQIDVVCVRIVVIGFNFIEMLMPQLMMIVFACWKGRHSHYEKGDIWGSSFALCGQISRRGIIVLSTM